MTLTQVTIGIACSIYSIYTQLIYKTKKNSTLIAICFLQTLIPPIFQTVQNSNTAHTHGTNAQQPEPIPAHCTAVITPHSPGVSSPAYQANRGIQSRDRRRGPQFYGNIKQSPCCHGSSSSGSSNQQQGSARK